MAAMERTHPEIVVASKLVLVVAAATAAAVPVQASAHAAALAVPAVAAVTAIRTIGMRIVEPMVLTVLVAEALVPWVICM